MKCSSSVLLTDQFAGIRLHEAADMRVKHARTTPMSHGRGQAHTQGHMEPVEPFADGVLQLAFGFP